MVFPDLPKDYRWRYKDSAQNPGTNVIILDKKVCWWWVQQDYWYVSSGANEERDLASYCEMLMKLVPGAKGKNPLHGTYYGGDNNL